MYSMTRLGMLLLPADRQFIRPLPPQGPKYFARAVRWDTIRPGEQENVGALRDAPIDLAGVRRQAWCCLFDVKQHIQDPLLPFWKCHLHQDEMPAD